MAFWDELNSGLRTSTRQWVDWAKRHAQDVGEAGVRHVERQDLLRERRQVVQQLGEYTAARFLVEDRKTIRVDAAEVREMLDRLRPIEERLAELARQDAPSAEEPTGDA